MFQHTSVISFIQKSVDFNQYKEKWRPEKRYYILHMTTQIILYTNLTNVSLYLGIVL